MKTMHTHMTERPRRDTPGRDSHHRRPDVRRLPGGSAGSRASLALLAAACGWIGVCSRAQVPAPVEPPEAPAPVVAPSEPVAQPAPAPAAAPAAPAVTSAAPAAAGAPEEDLVTVQFQNAPLAEVLSVYARFSGRELAETQTMSAAVTASLEAPVPKVVACRVIEEALIPHGIAIEPVGTNAFKAVARAVLPAAPAAAAAVPAAVTGAAPAVVAVTSAPPVAGAMAVPTNGAIAVPAVATAVPSAPPVTVAATSAPPAAVTGAAPPAVVAPAVPAVPRVLTPGVIITNLPIEAPVPGPAIPSVIGAPAVPAAPGAAPVQELTLKFQDAPLDQVLGMYAELTGRTVLKAPAINAVVTLRSTTRLTQAEAKQAIESILALNNIALVSVGERFLKVIQTTTARQEGMPVGLARPEGALPEGDLLISQIIDLKYMATDEVTTILQGLLHGYGKIQAIERTNSLLVTDTRSNLQRIMEVVEYLDKPAESKIETRVYEIIYADAMSVADALNELIADSQQQQQQGQRTGATRTPTPQAPTPPGVIRAPTPTSASIAYAMAERGLITGRVKILPDERTNVLIILSEPQNFDFFDQIIKVLDRQVDPEIIVRVQQLEYADADEAAGILNDLIGGSYSSSGRRTGTTGTTSTRTGATGTTGARTGSTSVRSSSSRTSSSRYGSSGSRYGSSSSRTPTSSTGDSRSEALREFLARQTGQTQAQGGSPNAPAGGIGEISPDTRILPDLRSNALILMGTKTDLAVLQEVIRQIDIMLAQVIIEAVIVEVTLSDNVTYGFDWLQRSLVAYESKRAGPGGGLDLRKPLLAFGGGFVSGTSASFRDASDVGRDVPLSGGGLTYYLTMNDLNLDAVLTMTAGSSDARVLSTPVILTADNTEASIIAGEERPIVSATTTTDGGNQTSSYEYRNIGIELTVLPRINPKGVVVMEVTQTADNVGDIVTIDGNEVPVITKRELTANLTVNDRATVVLGGMVNNQDRLTRTKVPILGDIPLLGRLFRSDTKQKQKTELLVFLTPYVIQSPDEAQRETVRLHDATNTGKSEWFNGWSDGDLSRMKRLEAEQAIDLRSRGKRGPSSNLRPIPRPTVTNLPSARR